MADLWKVEHVVYRHPLREFWKVMRVDASACLLNERSRLKRFKSAATAQAACDKLNAASDGVQNTRGGGQ